MEFMFTMRDVDDLKLQRRATMSLPWLTDILHGCEANLAARQQRPSAAASRPKKSAGPGPVARRADRRGRGGRYEGAGLQYQRPKPAHAPRRRRPSLRKPMASPSRTTTTRAGVPSTRSRCAGTRATPAAPAGLATSSPTAATAKASNHTPARDAHRAKEPRRCRHHPSASDSRRARRRTNSWPRACPRAAPITSSNKGGIARATTRRTTPSTTAPEALPTLETPERFVRAYVLRTLAQWEMAPSPGARRGPDPGRVARLLDPAPCPAYPELSALLRRHAAGAGHAALQAAPPRAGAAGAAPGPGGTPCCASLVHNQATFLGMTRCASPSQP